MLHRELFLLHWWSLHALQRKSRCLWLQWCNACCKQPKSGRHSCKPLSNSNYYCWLFAVIENRVCFLHKSCFSKFSIFFDFGRTRHRSIQQKKLRYRFKLPRLALSCRQDTTRFERNLLKWLYPGETEYRPQYSPTVWRSVIIRRFAKRSIIELQHNVFNRAPR